ncbi:MAG: hypothetical protein WDN45_07390 [Caulobacteraceae bacterium]
MLAATLLAGAGVRPRQPLAGGLIVYGALAWLCAAAATRGAGQASLRIGAALQIAAGAVWIALSLYLAARFGDAGAVVWCAGGEPPRGHRGARIQRPDRGGAALAGPGAGGRLGPDRPRRGPGRSRA